MEKKETRRSLPGKTALLTVVVMFIAVLSGAVICSVQEPPPPDASTPAKGKAEWCLVGAYLTSLHDFNFPGQTFGADIWLWTHTSSESERKPLETMEFTNAKSTSASLDSYIVKDGIHWGQRKVCGTFTQHWDLRNFPFDRHKLEIHIEEGIDDTTALTYEPTLRNSSYRKDIQLDDWKITDFRIVNDPVTHSSTFGDPALKPGSSSQYAGITLRIAVERKEVMSYIKLTAVAYIAFLLMLVSFFLHLDGGFRFLDSRITLLAGALFATVINMSAGQLCAGVVGQDYAGRQSAYSYPVPYIVGSTSYSACSSFAQPGVQRSPAAAGGHVGSGIGNHHIYRDECIPGDSCSQCPMRAVKHGVVSAIDHRPGPDATLQHLSGIGEGLFRLVQPIRKQGLTVGHIRNPSCVMALTMGDDRSGEFSSSSRVKMRGEITMELSKPTSHATSQLVPLRFLSMVSTSTKISMSGPSSASARS